MSSKGIKKIVNNIIKNKTGYRLTRSSALLDLRDVVNDPREGYYLSKNMPFIMNLPFSNGGDWLYSKYNSFSLSPYYQAAVAALGFSCKSEACEAIRDTLRNYSKHVVIKNPNELLGLSGSESHFNNAKNVWDMVLPWDKPDVQALSSMRGANIRAENLRYGLDSNRVLTDGVDVDDKIDVEVQRIYELLISAKKQGFILDVDNMISARIYIDNDELVWRVSGGMHRSAIFAAMGWNQIPIKVDQLVRREDGDYWPGVRKGIYSKGVAIKLFDRIFQGDAPRAFEGWKSHVHGAVSKAKK